MVKFDIAQQSGDGHEGDIAIIGMSGIFPQASSIEDYWDNLVKDVNSIRKFTSKRKQDMDYFLETVHGYERDKVNYLNFAYLEEIDCFDYAFFNMTHEEACLLDPAQRLLLQVVWHTVEESGYSSKELAGTNTGVFIGASDLAEYQYRELAQATGRAIAQGSLTGNITSLFPGRISYLMDWRGPSIAVDTSGSSSLVAFHKACQSIQLGECEQAIVGTSRIQLLPLRNNQILDMSEENLSGIMFGEGVMAVLIKPLYKALSDGDHIHSVIKGSAINHDGRCNRESQSYRNSYESLLVQAWSNANIDPSTISFIETHSVNDEEEIEGIRLALSSITDKNHSCAIGSVKANIGHLHHASGLAGLIKSVLSLKQKQIPPGSYMHIGYQEYEGPSPMFISDELVATRNERKVLRFGVNSFGMSGTNCHVILEEAPRGIALEQSSEDKDIMIFTLSAKSKASLKHLVLRYIEFLMKQQTLSVSNLCYSANTGRDHYDFRLAMIIRGKEDFLGKLRQLHASGLTEGNVNDVYYNEIVKRTIGKVTDLISSLDGVEQYNQICKAYIEGAKLDWKELYKNKKYEKISLPLYPFESYRCWFKSEKECDKRVKLCEKEEGSNSKNIALDEVNEIVKSLFKKYFGYLNIDGLHSFYELGGDSITAIKIVNEINGVFCTNIQDTELLKNPTVEQFVRIVVENHEKVKGRSATSLRRQAPRSYYPLSSAQKRIYVMSQYDLKKTIYNTPVALLIDGEIDHKKFQSAMNQVVQRHESLRTSFDLVHAEPVQIVNGEVEIQIEYYTAIINKEDIPNELKKFTKPFDLTIAPLLRAALYKLSNNQHALLLDIHHIISDGTSLMIFFKEILHYYEQEAELDLSSVQYTDYAIWESEIQSVKQDQLKQFWLSKFSEKPKLLSLRSDFQRPPLKTYEGDQLILQIGEDISYKANLFAKEVGVTIYVVLLAAYHLLLTKHSGQEDIVIGTIVQGRPVKELDNIIGMFVNTIMMRNKSSRMHSFSEFVAEVHKNTLQSLEHKDYPFEHLVADLNIQRDRSRNPLFDAAFILHNFYHNSINSNNITLHNYPYHNGISLVDIALEVFEIDNRLVCSWEYSTSLFRRETIEEWGRQYIDMLSQLISEPDIPLHQHDYGYVRTNLLEDVVFQF